jgi:hypothetical protein
MPAKARTSDVARFTFFFPLLCRETSLCPPRFSVNPLCLFCAQREATSDERERKRPLVSGNAAHRLRFLSDSPREAQGRDAEREIHAAQQPTFRSEHAAQHAV